MGDVDGDDGISRLPEECISHVLSLTTPRDACRSAAVSPTFRWAAASDTVWGRFLPSDHSEIVSRSVDPEVFASKRELYFRLCDPIVVDGGKMSFALERSSGKKMYMLSARELRIARGDSPRYWRWIQSQDSRFSEVAEMSDVCWLEVCGKLDTRVLSPKTKYAAYLIFRLAKGAVGLATPVQETSVKVADHVSSTTVRLQNDEMEGRRSRGIASRTAILPFGTRRRNPSVVFLPEEETGEFRGTARIPHARVDGWMEIEMGEFYNADGDDGEVVMSLREVKGGHWKSGLIVHGIELRPKL